LSVNVTDEAIVAHLADGRVVSVPLEWSWRLTDATPEQRAHWEIIGDGQGVHWPDVDEDISVEGMLRGVPAKRPSRTEMRILLDASSLIDAEHGKPVSFGELEKIMREHHARLILTYTNVLEFAGGPFDESGDWLELRGRLQQIERLPLGYIHEQGTMLAELREAVAAFKEKRECSPIDPYVRRWDETVRPDGASPMKMLVNQSLYDCVSSVLRAAGMSPLTLAKDLFDDAFRKQFQNDRALPLKTRTAVVEHFRETIQRHLVEHLIQDPSAQPNELADWIYDNPATRCPGYRLAWEMRRELMKNMTEKVSGNDASDMGNALAVPYVGAITMDRNAADRCRRVVRRLKAKNPAINYEKRIFTSLKELLDAKF
jgi:hypothetical protein